MTTEQREAVSGEAMPLPALGDQSNYEAMREFWGRHWSDTLFAKEYAANFYPRRQEEFEIIKQFISKSEPVLEAGCSFGHVAEYFRRMGYPVVGMDYVFEALVTGRVNAPILPFAQGDIHALPFKDNSLGAYLSFGVLEHFEFGPMPALREAFRVLKPGGVVAITMPVPTPLVREWIPQLRPWLSLDPLRRNNQLRRIFGKEVLVRKSGRGSNGFYEKPYSRAEVQRFLETAGFEVRLQRPIYHSFWLWLISAIFREQNGYYESNQRAEVWAARLKRLLPWSTAFMGLAIGIKPSESSSSTVC